MQYESSVQATPLSLLDSALRAAGLSDTDNAPLLAEAAATFRKEFVSALSVSLYGKSLTELRDAARQRASFYAEVARRFGDGFTVSLATLEYKQAIPGHSIQAQLARITDYSFWSRFYTLNAKRSHEFAYVKAGYVAKRRELYVSDSTLSLFRQYRKSQEEFLRNYYVVDRQLNDKGQHTRRKLIDVTKSAEARKAKLWAFLSGIEQLSREAGLSCGLLTLTLEESFHPNPSSGGSKYDGVSTPRDGARELSSRWNKIQRDLDNLGISISGARFVEPHGDACPHWHVWLHYQDSQLLMILAVISRYFSRGVRVRTVVEDAAGKFKSKKDGKRFSEEFSRFDTSTCELMSSSKRAARSCGVELSVINRAYANGATYAAKYAMKTLEEGDLSERVAASRWVWGFRSFQLFGIQRCLGAWDELFRARNIPTDPRARALYDAVHEKPGVHEKQVRNCDTGEVETFEVEGGTAAFIRLFGGLSAARSSSASLRVRLTYQSSLNRYGDVTKVKTGLFIYNDVGEYLYSTTTREPGRFVLVSAYVSSTDATDTVTRECLAIRKLDCAVKNLKPLLA